jgi:transcriptional regulator with XRE-family HTH domain
MNSLIYICGEMKERIKQFMDYMSLSAAELADQIGVQRSNVSHVLNGRNNPSSSFIEKLLLKFPDLDARWLIVGEGDMCRSKVKINPPSPPVDLFNPPVNEKTATEKERTHIDQGIDNIIILYADNSFKAYSKR